MPLEPGKKLGPYEIESALGAGGMGEVYKAKDTRLDRTVAIKVLPQHLSAQSDLRLRLEREAKAISKLSHPHICSLYDIGQEEGIDFLVMEYLDGKTLAETLAKEKLTTDQTLRVGVQIADALEAAHEQGIIHRDLKPGNVMLTASGVKLLDFGLAKAAEGQGGPVAAGLSGLATGAHSDQPLTAEGTILGTIQYMSPEQLEGREADARSDIFALGAVLYEMATGRKAFAGASQASLISAIMSSTPEPASATNTASPPALDWVIKTCLAKNPNDRFRSAHDLKLQLEWISQGSSQIGIPKAVARRWISRERVAWAAAFVLLVVSIATTGALIRGGGEERVVRTFIPPPEQRAFSFLGRGGPLEISPDGRSILYSVRDTLGNNAIWVRPLDELSARPIPGTEGGTYPFWAPDSRRFAFFVGANLKKTDLSGSPPVTLCSLPREGRGGTWNQDDIILAGLVSGEGLHRVSAAGGESEKVTTLDREIGEATHRWPQFLPDGKHFIYFSRIAQGMPDNYINVGRLDSEERIRLFSSQSNARYAAGYLLYPIDATLMARPFDAGKLKFTGEAFPIAENLQVSTLFSRSSFTVSSAGQLAYQLDQERAGEQLQWLDRQGNTVGFFGDEVDHSSPNLSPTEDEAVVVITDPKRGSGDLWIYDLNRELRSRFTFSMNRVDRPIYSPDGRTIVFCASDSSGTDNLYMKKVHGTTDAELLLATASDKLPSGWTPDGAAVLYFEMNKENSSWDIWMVPVDGNRTPKPLIATQFAEDGAVVSPDGKWMAFASTESGRYEVYVTTFPEPSRKWQISREGGDYPKWRSDGSEIYFVSRNVYLAAVEVRPDTESFEIGEEQRLFEIDYSGRGFPYDVTNDGQRILRRGSAEVSDTQPFVLVQNWVAAIHSK